jgi:hypothetical protein
MGCVRERAVPPVVLIAAGNVEDERIGEWREVMSEIYVEVPALDSSRSTPGINTAESSCSLPTTDDWDSEKRRFGCIQD